MRVGKNHLLAGLQQGCERHENSWRTPRCDHHLIRIHTDAIGIMVVFTNGFAQFQHAQAVGVMGEPIVQCLANRLFNAVGCIEIGFSNLEMNDILSFALKGAGLVKSKRGVSGGYYLARPPDTILLSQIVSAVDGPIVVIVTVLGLWIAVKTLSLPAALEAFVWNALQAAMGDLREEDRAMLAAVEWEGLSLEQVAQRGGLTISAVKSRLFRTRRQLRDMVMARFEAA